MFGYRPNRFAGIVSRYDPREPLPAELEGAFHESHALQTNLHLPYPTTTQAFHTHPACAPPLLHSNIPTYTIQEPSLGRNVLPPVSISIEASVIQDTASITVTQLFWNDSYNIIKEAAYTFPLSSGCTVTGFHCRIGHGKVLAGNVKPKEEAREEFQQHVRNRTTGAALLEQDTEEIFTTSLGNLPARTKIRVTVTYITLLKHHFADRKGITTLTIPTCIASRYGDKPQDYNNAASTSIPEGLTIQIEVVEAGKIASIVSPTHKVTVENWLGTRAASSFADLVGEDTRSSVETALVKLETGSAFLDRDFVLDIATGGPNDEAESPQAWIEKHPTLPNQQALMVTIPPGFTTRTSNPTDQTEILLLADLSGSMDDKLTSLRAAMQFFLKGIPNGRKFNVWCFGSSYKSWQPHSVDYGEASYQSASSWVDTNFHANMGGTELLPAVQAIVTARDKRLPTDIIILTDGETWRLDETLEYIRKQRDLTEGGIRFFALGIGPAVSHALVEGIAKVGGGYAEVVREASEGDWEDRIVSMAEAALMTDHLGPMHLEVNIMRGDGSKQGIYTTARLSDTSHHFTDRPTASSIHNAEQSPADISTLSPFNRSRIFFLFDSFKSSESITDVTLKADTAHRTKTFHVPVTLLEKPSITIHRLAARSLLNDLERGQSQIHLGSTRPYPGSWDERNRVRKEAEKIGCKWSLVSKWTSFFLKEELCPAEPDDIWCAEGGAEAIDEPGDDLLQSHGPIAGVTMVDSGKTSVPASGLLLVGELVSTPRNSDDLFGLPAGRHLQRPVPPSFSVLSNPMRPPELQLSRRPSSNGRKLRLVEYPQSVVAPDHLISLRMRKSTGAADPEGNTLKKQSDIAPGAGASNESPILGSLSGDPPRDPGPIFEFDDTDADDSETNNTSVPDNGLEGIFKPRMRRLSGGILQHRTAIPSEDEWGFVQVLNLKSEEHKSIQAQPQCCRYAFNASSLPQQRDQTYSWESEEDDAIEVSAYLPPWAPSSDLPPMDAMLKKLRCGLTLPQTSSPTYALDVNIEEIPNILAKPASGPDYNLESEDDQAIDLYTDVHWGKPSPDSLPTDPMYARGAYEEAKAKIEESPEETERRRRRRRVRDEHERVTQPKSGDNKPWTDNRIISELLRFQSAEGYFARGYSVQTGQINDLHPSIITVPEEEEGRHGEQVILLRDFLEEETTKDPGNLLSKHNKGQHNEDVVLLRDILGKEITKRLRTLRDKHDKDHMFGKDMALKERILFTIAVWVLLERDFASKRRLWVLMIRKAKSYLGGRIDRRYDAFDEMKAALEGAKIHGYKSRQDSLAAPLYVHARSFEVQFAVSKTVDTAARMTAESEVLEGEQDRDEVGVELEVGTGEAQGNSQMAGKGSVV
ncbi:uncharacterized protein PODANS_2_6630 [Podospora anserina S mat+]|uniref:Podospora anserina S mat+ genomic DNA chromosome 2, supercontig 2 n=1 Tax=Podospora anserina (strain S / ATCC MYA-4624 / DSM 980 / FGSC 10383) TaxID=515849 RepID=B2B639_PODAN|nr:uncharacterized protein PODANS_2_6630 [Podospora anserina S mat+]CAP73264.1 unnamed protein product [Podospora anserina S mat+]CDP25665.1 Putative poly [ADP-ribose] polymerase 4 [Podospora anserina S mat+]